MKIMLLGIAIMLFGISLILASILASSGEAMVFGLGISLGGLIVSVVGCIKKISN